MPLRTRVPDGQSGQLALMNKESAPKVAPQSRTTRRMPRAARRLTRCSCVGRPTAGLMSLAVLLTTTPPGLALSLERAASTVADATETTSVVAMSGANITMTMSEAAVTVERSAPYAAAEAWHDADLLNVAISARAARSVAHVRRRAAEWHATSPQGF